MARKKRQFGKRYWKRQARFAERSGEIADKNLEAGIAKGEDVANKFLRDSDFTNVETTRPRETQGIIDRWDQLFQDRGPSEDTQLALDTMKGQLGRSSDIKRAIEEMRSGLGGLTAQENEALRGQAYGQMGREFAGAQRALAANQARSGVRGGAAGAQMRNLNRERMFAGQAFENQLLVDNITQKAAAKKAFADYVQGVETDEWGRAQDFGTMSRGVDTDVFNRGATATLGGQNAINAAQNTEFEKQKYNNALNQAQTATRLGAVMGTAGLRMGEQHGYEGVLQNQQAMDLAKYGYDANAEATRYAADKAFESSLLAE